MKLHGFLLAFLLALLSCMAAPAKATAACECSTASYYPQTFNCTLCSHQISVHTCGYPDHNCSTCTYNWKICCSNEYVGDAYQSSVRCGGGGTFNNAPGLRQGVWAGTFYVPSCDGQFVRVRAASATPTVARLEGAR